MTAVALSTMWAQQPRFEKDMAAFAAIARDAGFSHVEVSHSTDERGLRELMQRSVLPLSSLHAPTPRARLADGRWNTDLNLAAEDEAERAAAVAATLRTIDFAAEAGAGYVVVHLGAVGARGLPADSALRRLYDAGAIPGAEAQAQRSAALEQRNMSRSGAIAAARRSLAELAAQARLRGICIGLENRMWYHEIPLPDELPELLAEHEPATVGYWHDVGHAEILHRLSLIPLDDWFRAAGDRLIGCHLHDMQGIVDHRAPGTGDVNWACLRDRLAPATVRTLEINQHQPRESLTQAVELLRREGIIPATVGRP